jgi:hypothetical protein
MTSSAPAAPPPKLCWLPYALPCVAVWSLYLLAFWPGLMSPDSLFQWEQMTRWEFVNSHPVFHTLLNWLITRVWLSPAAVALVQIMALAVVFGLVLCELRAWGVPRWARVATTAAFSLAPPNALMAITLWKDVPFSIALLGVFLWLLRALRTQGAAVTGRGTVWLALLLALLLLLRHNGLPTVALLAPALFLAVPRGRRRWVGASMATAGVVALLVNGPLYRALGVQPAPAWFALQLQIHQAGAVLSRTTDVPPATMAVLMQVQPLEDWRRYSCYTGDGVVYKGSLNRDFFETNSGEFLRAWGELVLEFPVVMLRHQRCVSSLVWQVPQPADGFLATYQAGGIPENPLGLRSASRVPKLKATLERLLEYAHKPHLIWLVWRPALYLYLALACIAVLAWRWRSPRLLLLAAPALANSLVWVALSTGQEFRFQFGVYLIGLVAPVFLFARGTEGAAPKENLLSIHEAGDRGRSPRRKPARSTKRGTEGAAPEKRLSRSTKRGTEGAAPEDKPLLIRQSARIAL